MESLTQQRKEDMKTLAQALKEVHERNKQIKYLRHGNLIKPPEIYWPPGYKSVERAHEQAHHVMLISLHQNLLKGNRERWVWSSTI